MNIPTIYTIGYQQRSLPEFVALLTAAAVDVLVDVRETAWSHKPGFSKTALSSTLADHGMAYVHARFAGNPKELRRSAASHADCLQRYAEYLDSNDDIVEAFDELIGRLVEAGKRVAITCYERHPDDCHRGVLAQRWNSAGASRNVAHLGADNSCRLIPA
jgi:uncharacterized protein (DUF488 family)